MGLAFVLFYANSSSLFLTTYGANMLPFIYISVGVLVPVASWGFSRLQRRWNLAKIAPLVLICFLAMFVLSWLGLLFPDSRWLSFFLMIGYALGNLFSAIIRGSLAGQMFDARALKRNYPLILGGHVLSIILGGALIPVLVGILGKPEHLLLVSGFSMGCALLVNLFLVRTRQGEMGRDTQEPSVKKKVSLFRLLFNKYLLLLLLYQVFSTVGSQLVDFIFNSKAEQLFPDAVMLVQFFGNFMAIVTAVGLVFVLFVAGKLLVRFGMSVGLSANPIAVFFCLLVAAVTGLFTGPGSSEFIWLALTAMAMDFIFTTSFTDTSIQSSYQPISKTERAGVQTIIEGLGIPVAFGLTGFLLLLLNMLPGIDLLHIVWFSVLVFGGWVYVSILLFRSYTKKLSQSMRRKTFDAGEAILTEKLNYNLLGKLLKSEDPVAVSLGLDLLETSEYELYYKQLVRLIMHPHPDVRFDAAKRIERSRVDIARDILAQYLDLEPDPRVRAQFIRAFCALDPEPRDHVREYLESRDQGIRLAVMAGLLRYGGISGVLEVGQRLLTMSESPVPQERSFAAKLLGEVGSYSFYQPLMKLLIDSDLEVRRQAVRAAREVKNPKLWPGITENLKHPLLRAEALGALSAFGPDVIPLVEDALNPRSSYSKDVVLRLVRALSLVRGERVMRFLEKYIPFRDFEIEREIKNALSFCGFRISRKDRRRFDQVLEREVSFAVQIRRMRLLFQGYEEAALLWKALSDLSRDVLSSIFLSLSFVFDARIMQGIYQKLSSGNKNDRALAAELADLTLYGAYHELVFPLVDEEISDERLEAIYTKRLAVAVPDFHGALSELIQDRDKWPSSWVRSCALFTVMKRGDKTYREIILEAARDEDPLVRETALWAFTSLAPDDFQIIQTLVPKNLASLLVRRMDQQKGGRRMLFTIEKVLVLKSATMFSSMPDHLLASIAAIVEEVEVSAGETFLKKGEIGDCMYIIAEGAVRVHDNTRELALFGKGEAVGELAVLDPETRSASATAVEDTLLFRIDKDNFDELLADRPEIAQGVIRVLCQRVRETTRRQA